MGRLLFFALGGMVALSACEPTIEDDRCVDLKEEDMGLCQMVLGVGVFDGECRLLSGCSWPEDQELFDSVEECEETCDP